MRKLHLAAELFSRTRLNELIAWSRDYFVSEIPVLAYHRVMDIPDDYPFDIGLISASQEKFWDQMKYIKKKYQPIPVSELSKSLAEKKSIPKKSVAVTFDDGFDDNYNFAYPIMKDLGIPATIFVATDFIGSTETIWYERLAYFFNRTNHSRINISELDASYELHDPEHRKMAYCDLVEKLKVIPDEKRAIILSELYQNYGDPYDHAPESVKSLSAAMTWDNLREMRNHSIEVGSHTVTHPILSMLSVEQLNYELSESRNILENQLQSHIDSIAYPVGQEESFSQAVIEMVKKAGYEIGFSYIDGVSNLRDIDRFAIERLHVDLDTDLSLFSSKLSLPGVFCE